MQTPLQIQFRNLEPSTFIEAAARKRAATLERFVDDIISCRVTIEAPHQKQQHGNLYNVSVDVRVPGKEVVVSRSPDDDHAFEDVYVAMRDAKTCIVETQLNARNNRKQFPNIKGMVTYF